jgi:hypothetical protein
VIEEWEVCESCDDGFVGHNCEEDVCCCSYPEENVPCQTCEGRGGWERKDEPVIGYKK